MDITHGGSFVPDPTPTGGPEVSQLNLADGTGVSWTVTRQAGIVVATPSVVNSALPGSEIGYDQITATVNVTGLSSGTATTIIAAAAHTFDGTPVMLEFFTPQVITPSAAAGNSVGIGLYESGSLVSLIATVLTPTAANMRASVCARQRFTPSAGSHTYTIAAFVSSTTGTPQIVAGTGVGAGQAPAFLRFTRV